MENKLQTKTAGPIGLINQARNGTLVTSANEIKIKAALAACSTYMGINNQPDRASTTILIDFVTDKLTLFTLEEMILAFKNLAANEYICENEHYGKLSPAYLKDVMDAYKYWRDKHRGQEQRKDMLPSEEIKSINYEECFTFIRDYCDKHNKIPYGANWAQCYDYLFREERINPTTEEKENIKTIVSVRFKGKYEEKEFLDECKKEYILQYFEMLYGITRPHMTS